MSKQSVKAVANKLLELAEQENIPVTPMKLQKLLYYTYGWHLGLFNTEIFPDAIEAWDWGPVVHEIFDEFRDFGNEPITRRAQDIIFDDENLKVGQPILTSTDIIQTVDRVWDVYKAFTAIQLSNMTHATGTPWHQIKEQVGQSLPRRMTIPVNLIRNWFASEASNQTKTG